ncbi:MAG: thiamine phosphate synthase [Acidobacteria bacterium]|nr:thiamine phosphate synthase [Acidobacteriota bacterium]
MPSAPFRICYITDRLGLAPKPLLSRIQVAVEAGVDLIQLREKDLPTRGLAELAEAAVRVCRGTETKIVINDRLDIAMGVGADGVHLSGQSLPVEIVRSEAGKNFLIGVSCHSLDDAVRAETAGANYILLGPIFETPSKLRYGPPLGIAKLSEVAKRTTIAVFALGDVTVERTAACLAAGAKGVAGIRIFQDCPSLADQIQKLRSQQVPPQAGG